MICRSRPEIGPKNSGANASMTKCKEDMVWLTAG